MARLALAAGLAEAANVLRETGNRLARAPDVAATVAGSRRPKRLRARVVILRDERGVPVAAAEDVEPSLEEARRVLREQAGIELVPALEPMVATLDASPPRQALDSPCTEGSWRADFGPGGDFFRRFGVRGPASGSGAPITVFVVREVLGKAGCSLGPLVDYVTVDKGALSGRTKRVLVHELGHACSLPHSRLADNLMLPRRMGDRLVSWQVAVLRGSRHVTFR